MNVELDQLLRVLVIDADIDAAAETASLLRADDCKATLAANPEQGTRVAALFQPHLVLMNVDGVEKAAAEAIQRIKTINAKLVPLFCCTTRQLDNGSDRRWLQAGSDYVIGKPATQMVMFGVLEGLRRLRDAG